QRHELHRRDGGELQWDERDDLHGDVDHGDPGDGAGRGDDGAAHRDDVRRGSDQREHLHGIRERAHDHGLHADERAGGGERHHQRHELHRRDGGELQWDERDDLHGDVDHGDPGDGAGGGDDGAAQRHDVGRHRDEQHQLHGHPAADHYHLLADQWAGGGERHHQRHELHRRDGGAVQRDERDDLHGDVDHGDPGDGAGGDRKSVV